MTQKKIVEKQIGLLQKSLHDALWSTRAHNSNRTNRNPFDRNMERPRTKRLIQLIGEARMKLHIVEKLLAGEALGL